jgi:putative ABC transport system permease protein
MLQHIDFIARNALRNRRRSTLTVASVTVSLCLLGVLIAMYRSLFTPDDTSPVQALRLVVHHKVSLAQSMPAAYKDKIAQVPGVEAITTWQWFGGVYKDARDSKNFFARFGVDPAEYFIVHRDVVIPDDQKQAFINLQTGCIVDKILADRMKWKLGDLITITGDIFPVELDLNLVGIYTSPDKDGSLIYHNHYLQESLATDSGQRDTAGAFLILADKPENVPSVAKAIDAMFANSPAPTKSESEKDFILSFLAFLGNLKLFLAAISAAVMFTILLVSANTVAMTVRERVRETAILRTIGFSPSEICGLVIGEAGLLSAVGGVLACAGAAALCAASHNSDFQFRLPLFKSWMAAIILAVAVGIGVISAAAPAWLASRRSVVESMRYSG